MTAPLGRPRLCSPREVLTALRGLESALGYPPTVRELAEELGVGVATASRYLLDLEQRGWVERWPKKRGVRVTKRGRRQKRQERQPKGDEA